MRTLLCLSCILLSTVAALAEPAAGDRPLKTGDQPAGAPAAGWENLHSQTGSAPVYQKRVAPSAPRTVPAGQPARE